MSSTPVTVTVCMLSQFEFVKVTVPGDTVASPVSFETIEMTALDSGWYFSEIPNPEVDPVSETPSRYEEDWSLGFTCHSSTSSSAVITVKDSPFEIPPPPSKASPEPKTVIVVVWSPSRSVSSTPVRVTACRLFQFDPVNVTVDGDTLTSPVSNTSTPTTASDDGCDHSFR